MRRRPGPPYNEEKGTPAAREVRKGAVMKPAVLIETWNGFLFVLLSAAVLALLVFLLETGKGLMRGSGRTAAKTAFWVLTAVHWVCQILFGFSLLFSHPAAALTGAVIQILGFVRLMSARGTSRTAGRRNRERIRESGFARDLIALVRQERPVRIAVFSDGVVFCTAFGSTGYFQSITRGNFQRGIGIAFSNSMDGYSFTVLPEDAALELELLRGPACLVADNNPRILPLADGEHLQLSLTAQATPVFGLDAFRCQECYLLRRNGV